jgi:hypothetical protein
MDRTTLHKEWNKSFIRGKPTKKFEAIIIGISDDIITKYHIVREFNILQISVDRTLSFLKYYDTKTGFDILDYFTELSKRSIILSQNTIINNSIRITFLNLLQDCPDDKKFGDPNKKDKNTITKEELIKLIIENKVSIPWIKQELKIK